VSVSEAIRDERGDRWTATRQNTEFDAKVAENHPSTDRPRKRECYREENQKLTRDFQGATSLPNGPSSATASAARVERTARSRIPATLERTAGRPFAAAHG
jgi:hypothetical protein